METSRYFERTLFYDRSPAADEYYARSTEWIFEKDPKRSKIEARVQSSHDVSHHERKKESATSSKPIEAANEEVVEPSARGAGPANKKSANLENEKSTPAKLEYGKNSQDDVDYRYDSDSDDALSISSKASSTALPAALDHHRGSCPPTYPGPPKLTLVDLDPSNVQNFVKRTKHCFRVFYVRQRHSYSRLLVTKELFEQLLRLCHVFPRFNEYLIGFTAKNSDSEVGPPPLTFRPLCESHSNSYHGFECSYILRYVEFTNRPGGKFPWSLRQFAVYHRYKPKSETGCSTWILVGASQRAEVRLDQYTRSIDDLTSSNPFELHVIFIDTAIASWRPYLVDLTKLVTHQSNKAVGIFIDGDEEEAGIASIEVEDHQQLKQIEDQIADLILCLDSTLDTLSTFEEMYEQYCSHQDSTSAVSRTPRRSAYGSDAVVLALTKRGKDIAYTRKKAEALLSKVQNTRTLISSLLERQGGHRLTQQMDALEKLERQGQDENAIMRQLTEKSTRDSSSMRILTIITMIYLPCTIVSNFYSTQFVNQKDLPSGGTQLEYAQNAYLFPAIAVPLTLFTILIWYLWVNWEKILRLATLRKHKREVLLRPPRAFPGLPR